ncbi:TATA-binding protein-associated factor TAF6 KNAG_0F02370 [Huiozyma naganishii CBS 8797]|uniref:TBP-associated factor 6 n=1 Tax=Huiozyma naganishii (strain ATCC MYA-139 / BCRC 22969 / CBS 8797 / KCTC 17520 / NBRC 10181 / NCYC 3082 / Yp74L-3) TaxID=1071383 RepID=J7S054_HUIN7|nr:hypothetical protein KNAG_0F02370 [Kazachstania naganishii CBS 8797]CCK70902.1 hypothetical protein KNAG_0F02370 [Kazachstania naganishii CBS 8797]
MSNPQSYTIWSPQDTVKDVAESLGLDNINEDVLKALAMDVEYRILEIIEQAVKFKRHSKTEILTTDDIAKALRVLNVEPLYGYHDSVTAKNGTHNTAHGTAQSFQEGQPSFRKVNTSGGQQVYYLDEEEVDFDKLVNKPLPPLPRLPTFTTHWLAIEGVQPAILQNPNLNDIRTSLPPTTRGAIVTALNESNSLQTQPNASATTNGNGAAGTLQQQQREQHQLLASSVKPGQNIEVKPLVKHVLSKELQIYFNKIISALTVKDEATDDGDAQHMKLAALTSLKTDNGLHQLVPYFIQFIAEQITHNLSNLELLTTILEMIYSLLSNPSIFLEPYIHSLMPSILTLLLAKNLGGSSNGKGSPPATAGSTTAPPSIEEYNEQLDKANALRDFAASLLDYVLKKFPQVYKSLKPRVTRTLLKTFLDTNRVFGTYYGSLKGVTVLESESIRFFLGNLYNWSVLVFNEHDLTLGDFEGNEAIINKTKKFTDYEVQTLTKTVIDTLSVLKKDLPDIYEGKGGKVTDEEKDKLVKRCGVTIAAGILKRDDAKEYISAIFFGE